MMGATCPNSPPPQDAPPPRASSPSQDIKAGSTAKLKHAATNWQLSGPLQQLFSSSELEAATHDVFTEDGREMVLLVALPLDDLLPSKSPTLISLVTLWVNVLLRKAARMKHWPWAYVLHILNNEAASVTFDELFKESIHCSQGDMTTQVFLSVLQNESLQDELSNFLREFAQKLVAKGDAIQLHKLKNLGLTVSSSVMESSELRVEFESFTRGGYERVLRECTTPDNSDEPPHLTAYLTILLDDADVLERLPTGCSGGEGQPPNMYRAQHVTSKCQYTDQQLKCHTVITNCVNLNVTVAGSSTTHPKSEDSNSTCDSGVSESETEDPHAISACMHKSDLNASAGFENATHQCMPPGAPQSPQRSQQESEEDQDTSGIESVSDCESSDSSSKNYQDKISRNMNSSKMENQTIPTGCLDGESQPTNSPTNDPPPSSREAESISRVQSWLSQSDSGFSSSGTESDCQNQRMPNKGKSAFKQRQGNAIFRHISSSGSDSEQVGHHEFSNPMHFFPTVAGTSETFDILPSRANIIHRERVESTNELLPPRDPSNIQSTQTESSTSLSTELPEGRSSTSSSEEDDMTSLEADDLPDGEGTLSKTKCRVPVATSTNGATAEPSATYSKPEEHMYLKSLCAPGRNESEANDCLNSVCKEPALLAHQHFDPNVQNKEGDTPLHSTVKHNITPEISQLLTSEQSNPNVMDNDTNTHSGSGLNSTKEAAQLCFQELASAGKSIRILVTGQVGQGKSTLVNSLMGKEVAKEEAGPRSVTRNSESFTEYINGVQVTAIDTPGFNDSCISDKDTTLELAKEICEEPVDLILFCVRMDGRMETDIDTIMQNMTLMLEQSIWRYAIFVLTFANKVDPATFVETQAEWDMVLHEYVRTKGGVQADIAQRIPVVVAGNEEENLPGCESWLAQFWVTAHDRITKNACLPLTGKLNWLANFDSGDERSSKDAVQSGGDTSDINKDIQCTPVPDVVHSTSDLDTGVPIENVATSYVCTGTTQHPMKEQDMSRKLAAPHNISTNSSVNPSPNDVGEQLVYSTEQNEGVSTYRQSNGEASHLKLPAGAQESVDTQHLITERENANDTIVMPLCSAPPPPPQLWHTEVLQNSSNLASLKTFILSLPVEMLVFRDAAEDTLCHTLVGLVGKNFSPTEVTHLLELLGEGSLQHCMVCQDSSGNTPLHCAIEAKNASADVVKFLLRFTTRESVTILNNDSLTPLELSYEMKLWSITQLLIEHQIEAGASCAAKLLQEYFFKVMKEGNEFLPRLLGLKEHYCPDLDLNFSESRSSRTPWWHLAHFNDASVMGRVLRTLKDHSIEFESLKIRSGYGKNLVEEAKAKAEAKNNVLHMMIQTVNEYQHSEELLPLPSAQPAQIGSSTSTESSSSTSSSKGGMTSLEADDSSDGGSEGVLSKAKRSTKRTRKKTIPAVQQCCPITTGTKKRSNLSVVYQCSGYSGDDSDHKNTSSQTKSSKFTSAQRTAAIKRKERFNKESGSEYSGAETEDCFVHIRKATDREPTSVVPSGIKLTFQGTSCTLQIINCLSLNITPDSKSTELHHAVRQQYFQSVRDVLACDGGEDQIQMIDEGGHTPLQIASQNKDLKIFDLLLETLICSQVSSPVTLPPCYGHHQMALLASIVKVLSKKEIDIDYSTLHWTMVSCQHWTIPRVVYATPTTVLTMTLLEIELLWSYQSQLLMDTLLNSDELLYRGGKKKRLMQIAQKGRAVVPSVAAATQELAAQNEQGITAGPTSSHATTDRTAEDSCYKSSSVQFTHKQSENQELAAVQEQGIAFQSEMVSVTRTGDLILIRAYTNSLVTGLTLLHSKGLELHQTRTSSGIPPHQPTQTPDASTTATDSTPSLVSTTRDKKTLPRVAADSPSYSQPKPSPAKQSTQRQVSRSSAASASLKPLGLESEKEVTAWQAWIDKAVDCLHAGYYSQMLEVLKFGKVPPPLPAEIAMAAQFGCALAYYKLEKYSEAAKHLESLKTIAASAHSCGNESIASVYLGDIEFTQSRYTEAAKHYSHALKLYKSDNLGKEYRLIVPTFSAISAKLGTAFRNTSKVVDAVQAYRQAIATADSKKDKLSAHTSLGNLFQSVGENASALAEYEHSIKLSEELRDYVSLGWAHGNMGNAYLGLYQRDKGLYHLEKALDLTVEHEPTPQAIGRAYNNLGTAYQALNELDKAEEKYDLALSQSIYGNDLPGQARVYGNIGNVLMLRKDYDRAVPHYTEVLRLSRDRSTVSTAFHNRGCSYYEWAESKKATLPQKAGFCLHGPEFENCEVEHQPSFKSLPNSILKYYQLGRQDLEQVIKYHEETFENIKGSSKGLTLSVSLFETNSRTFHRLQDCLVNLGEWEKALVVAEQSRTRTLGELLVKRKNSMIDNPLTAPLNLQSITDIVQSQHSVVVYLSYTGARLLGWVLAPTPDKVSLDMFEVPLEDDQFDGKSFDYHLRYSLTEELVERSFEMYRAVDYKSDLSEPVRKLYKLVCRPLMKILKELKDPESSSGVREMIIIPDSYTCLLPFPCLLDEEDKFLGDSYSFRIMPSLLTMGIVDQLPSVVVQVPADGRSMCVVGNPTIPSFMYNGDQWSLGKLPFATREAEWVANILKTTPILHEQATKDAVLMRIMNAKVIHIATHGSASAGFLAFAGMSSARNGETVEAKNVLLYPEDIERLSISPALVVLSSCDSARGTVKADGILGMARAFILAGAQAVLTTLWRVPDESASVFMQFFYQYLMDGLKASLALQKSTLSVRCFSKYSQYIHWSGYQLTGREIQFDITMPITAAALDARLDKSSVFPRLEVVQQLESVFLKDPRTPSDVQILRGSPGVKPSEPLVDFIHSFHHAFQGGIFWINCRRQEFVDASAAYIKKATGTVPTASQTHPVLVVFDHIDQMPQFSDPSTSLVDLLKHQNTHIVVISTSYTPPDALLREIDNQLLRGCNIIDVKPLSPIHTTQRIVHSILSAHHLAPANEDQKIFEKLAQFTSGSPAIIDVTTAVFLSQMEHNSQNESQGTHDTLISLNNQLSLDGIGPSTKPVTIVRHEPPKGTAKTREISKDVCDNIVSIRYPEQDPWCTSSPYDSWQAVTILIDQCSLSAEEKLLLFAVSMFSCSPIPMSMVTEISSMIAKASQKPHISTSLHSKLFQMQLMKRYPLPVILHPRLGVQQPSTEPEFVYVPQYIARAIWKDMMSDGDKVVALSTMYMALRTLEDNLGSADVGFLAGLSSLLIERYELNYELMGKQCYQEVYKIYLSFYTRMEQQSKMTAMTDMAPSHSAAHFVTGMEQQNHELIGTVSAPQGEVVCSPPSSQILPHSTVDTLDLKDLVDITEYLLDLEKVHIYNLGLVLGLSDHNLKAKMEAKMDSNTFLSDVIASWLQKGEPSWKVLINALQHPRVKQTKNADRILKDKELYLNI